VRLVRRPADGGDAVFAWDSLESYEGDRPGLDARREDRPWRAGSCDFRGLDPMPPLWTDLPLLNEAGYELVQMTMIGVADDGAGSHREFIRRRNGEYLASCPSDRAGDTWPDACDPFVVTVFMRSR
jgi:hypothetical protein